MGGMTPIVPRKDFNDAFHRKMQERMQGQINTGLQLGESINQAVALGVKYVAGAFTPHPAQEPYTKKPEDHPEYVRDPLTEITDLVEEAKQAPPNSVIDGRSLSGTIVDTIVGDEKPPVKAAEGDKQ